MKTIHQSPVVGKKHWAIQVTSFGVGTKEDDLQTCDPCAAVVDSGTSSLGMRVRKLYSFSSVMKCSPKYKTNDT